MNVSIPETVTALCFGTSAGLWLFAGSAHNDDTCYAVDLEGAFLDSISELYYGPTTRWGGKVVSEIYACPLHRIDEAHAGAEGLYSMGAVFVARESGVLEEDEYGQSLLVNELVHYLQEGDGKLAKVDAGELRVCDVENEAYRLQKAWLQSIGSDWDIDWSDECYSATSKNHA